MLRRTAIPAALAFAIWAPSAGATNRPHRPPPAGTSKRWSGYAIVGTAATQVIGHWSQPQIRCARRSYEWASAWVGMDGDVDHTVQQIGTEGDCVDGRPRYYAWYEIYPAGIHAIHIAVAPGLAFTAEVSYLLGSHSFLLSIEDTTTGQTFAIRQKARHATRTSVEWVLEGPPSYGLADFGEIVFSSISATIDARTGAATLFPRRQRIDMIRHSGKVRARPSPLSNDSFAVDWRRR